MRHVIRRIPALWRASRLARRWYYARFGAYPDWREVLASDRSMWDSARAAARGGPRVLMATAIGSYAHAVSLESALAAALTFRGAEVHALLGIADPHAFVRQLELAGARVVPSIYPDHHPFRAQEIERFVSGLGPSAWAVCTLKDAVKLGPRWPRQGPSLWYVSQRVTVERGVGGLERVLDDLVRPRSRLTPTAG